MELHMYYEATFTDNDGRSWPQIVCPDTTLPNWVNVRVRGQAYWSHTTYRHVVRNYGFPNYDRHMFDAACRFVWTLTEDRMTESSPS